MLRTEPDRNKSAGAPTFPIHEDGVLRSRTRHVKQEPVGDDRIVKAPTHKFRTANKAAPDQSNHFSLRYSRSRSLALSHSLSIARRRPSMPSYGMPYFRIRFFQPCGGGHGTF